MESVTCKICRRQFARYTCPSCNVSYCSLTCFRSEAHAQCSEAFYRKEIESDIHKQSSKSNAERVKMMQVLKRFEEESQESEIEFFQDEAEDDTDLTGRLQNIDLESTSSDAIWSMLTFEERKRFLRALHNPSGELARQLLANGELEKERHAPWWEETALDENAVQSGTTRQFRARPEMMQIPPDMIKPQKASFLVYNLCVICIAYAYTTRYLSVSPLSSLASESLDTEGRRILCQLLPFLVDRNARTLHTSLSSIMTDIWSRFDAGAMTASYLAVLLRDAEHLLQPTPVTILPPMKCTGSLTLDLDTHPHVRAILMLSDLSKLFKTLPREHNHITKKLLFYAAHVLSTPSSVLSTIADEAMAQSKTIEKEAVDSPGRTARIHSTSSKIENLT